MKKCPYCSELIQDDAKKCRHCGEFLDQTLRQSGGESNAFVDQVAIENARKKARQALVYSIVGIIFFGIILGPVAFFQAGKANKTLASLGQPRDGRASAARILGALVTVVWLFAVVIRILDAIATASGV